MVDVECEIRSFFSNLKLRFTQWLRDKLQHGNRVSFHCFNIRALHLSNHMQPMRDHLIGESLQSFMPVCDVQRVLTTRPNVCVYVC